MMAVKTLMEDDIYHDDDNDDIEYFDALSDHQCSQCCGAKGGAQLSSATQIWTAIPCWRCQHGNMMAV